MYSTDTDIIYKSSRRINNRVQPHRRRRYCACPPPPRMRDDFFSKPSWGAYFEQTTISEHDAGCPFAKFSRKASTTKAGARFCVHLRGLFSTLVDISMCLTTGAGGFSLSPGLRCVRILAERGPVSRLIYGFVYPKLTSNVSGQAEKMADRLLYMKRQITTCFEQGVASPYDIDQTVCAPYCIVSLKSPHALFSTAQCFRFSSS